MGLIASAAPKLLTDVAAIIGAVSAIALETPVDSPVKDLPVDLPVKGGRL